MSATEQAADKIFARPPRFAVHFRAGRRLSWSNEARTDYTALFLLRGKMRWQRRIVETNEAGEIHEGGALLAAPGDVLSASSAGRVEHLLATLAP
ncbi:MAG TPA: hypothetical protein VEX60_03525, partial [Pyrinomonadaceae bacterium]|nr:hypothetical protein [Pyrinomonadaceae bacterium]